LGIRVEQNSNPGLLGSKGSGFEKRTAEPQNNEYRISKCGIARAAQALAPRVALSIKAIKIDRIHSFDILHSIFDILRFAVSLTLNL
jgi:hypothetical protein